MSGLLTFCRPGSSVPSARAWLGRRVGIERLKQCVANRRRGLPAAGLALLCLVLWGGVGRAADAQCPGGTVPPLSLPATAAAVAAGRPVTIVALGSSSTAGIGASTPDRTYPAQLEA